MRRWSGARAIVAVLAAVSLSAACTSDGDSSGSSGLEGADPGDCTPVDMAVSPEKISLLTELARTFNESDAAELDEGCVFIRPARKSSGTAANLLSEGWPDEETNGARPVVWSPASSAWASVVNQRLDEQGQDPIAGTAEPFMLTPLVIAMPQPMADALGYPERAIGWSDILALASDPQGWAAYGHPEWGAFKLGKTNPNFSTSGLSSTIAQYYAATGKTTDLTLEDLARPEVQEFATTVESAVVHYGDITPTFLNNWYRNDAQGTALTYVSAVAVEEKSVIDYNQGNPDGVLDPGEEAVPPKTPLVAIYPKEGTLYSDNPYIVLDAPWVSDEQREGAERFEEFVRQPENQEKVLAFGFRPGNTEVALSDPIVAANGVDPDQPQTLLEVPDPPVTVEILDAWATQRKKAKVLIVLDVSGSMAEPAGDDRGSTKLDLAKEAIIAALDDFAPEDEVGLRIFTSDVGPDGATTRDLVPIGPIGTQRETMASAIRSLVPLNATPLYTVTQASYEDLRQAYDPSRINAVVLLTDGRNDDGDTSDDRAQLDELLDTLGSGAEGQAARPVRVFPIAYGQDADIGVLREVAEASDAAVYDASDASTIATVFTAVISNF